MLLSRVDQAWRLLGDPCPGLIVAVSGGPDSVALLRALIAARGPQLVPLVMAHLNHQLRGEESDADERFINDLHAHLLSQGIGHLQLASERLDVAKLVATHGGNLEATARTERYRWLSEVARSHGLRHIATGHTANDQAETVLHRLLRGSGLDGLRGIASHRELERGVQLIRPLINVTREQVLVYLKELGQHSRHDATNDDRRFTRNRIRHELLPLLASQYNPRIVEVLGRLSEQATEAFAEEEAAGAELLARAELPRAGELVVLDAECLRRAATQVVRSAFRLVWRRERWSMARMGFAHWQALAQLVSAESGAHDLPFGVRARRRGQVIQLQGSGSS